MRLGVERVKLAQRISKLKADTTGDEEEDLPQDPSRAADEALSPRDSMSTRDRLSRAAKADIFRAVVLAKTKEMRQMKETETMEQNATKLGSVDLGSSSSSSSTKR